MENLDLYLRSRRRGCRVECFAAVDLLHIDSLTPRGLALDLLSGARVVAQWFEHNTIDGQDLINGDHVHRPHA